MPRYFFDVRDGQQICDDVGVILTDLTAARRHALRYVSALISELDDSFWAAEEWQVDVRDESGMMLFSLMLVGVDAPAVGSYGEARH